MNGRNFAFTFIRISTGCGGSGGILMVHQVDALHVSDIDILQSHRRAIAQPARIVHIADKVQSGRKQARRTAHQKDEEAQNQCGDHDGQPHSKLSPVKLLLTRHGFSNCN